MRRNHLTSNKLTESQLRRVIAYIIRESSVDLYRADRAATRNSIDALEQVYQDLSSTVAEWQNIADVARKNKVMDLSLTAAAYDSCIFDLNELLPAINPRVQRQGLVWLVGMLVDLAADWRHTAKPVKQSYRGYQPIKRDGATFIACADYLENDIIPWIDKLIAERG